MAKLSGSVKGPKPTKSRGEGLLKPWEYFISFACSQPAGNCKFKSTPVDFQMYQPNIKNNKIQ